MIDPQVATLEQKLSALFQMMERRCEMENNARLNPFPATDAFETAELVKTNLNNLDASLELVLVPIQTDEVVVKGRITEKTAELLVSSPKLARAVMEVIYNDAYSAILAAKPFLADKEAILAGTSVITFKLIDGNFLLKQSNGEFGYEAYSNCIPYPKVFLK